jgi:hypothetical protein
VLQAINAANTATAPLALQPSGGAVGIGTTNPGNPLSVSENDAGNYIENITNTASTGDGGIQVNLSNVGSGNNLIDFEDNQGVVGNITTGTNSVSYNTTSDIRLKENIATTSEGLSNLMQIPVEDFNFINDPTQTRVQGFMAQGLYPIYPEAVSTNGTPATGPLGTSTPWEVDYGRLTPLIVSAVQDIANISSTFELNLIAWLGNAENGIVDLFAENGHFSNELCVGSTCVTPAQFQAMAAAADQTTPSEEQSAGGTPAASEATDTPPQIQINGGNPAIIQVGATYNDLGATITGPQQDLNLGIETFVNGVATSPIQIDTSQAATDTIDYVVTDQGGLTSTSTRTVIIEPTQSPSMAPSDDASSSDATTSDATSTTSSS